MGILENKHRIIDSTITQEGRRQLASGMMKIEYYSFTDRDVFYQSSSLKSVVTNLPVADDAASRLYFESPYSLPEDQITPEADDSGRLRILAGVGQKIKVVGGKLLAFDVDTVTQTSGSNVPYLLISGSAFASQIEGLLTSSFDNFKQLNLIKSQDRFFDFNTSDTEFDLSTNTLNFSSSITNRVFGGGPEYFNLKVEDYADFLSDIKFSNSKNFEFLPPIKKLPVGTQVSNFTETQLNSSYSLGPYIKVRQDLVPPPGSPNPLPTNTLDFNTLDKTFLLSDQTIFLLGKISQIVDTDKIITWGNYRGFNNSIRKGFLKNVDLLTSAISTKIASQIFEVDVKNNTVKKLDILDMGTFNTGDKDRSTAQVFMAGKVFVDSKGRDKFFHIFTLVFD